MRVPTRKPLTTMELIVAADLSRGLKPKRIAQVHGLTLYTTREYIKQAAAKIPGTLPAASRIIVWYRGGESGVLGVPS